MRRPAASPSRWKSAPARPPIRHGQAEYGDPDRLYQPWWEGAEAYGIVEDGALLAAVEVCPEEYANRLRVTELWVDARLRRQGVGSRLMDLAKAVAAQDGRRAVVLETQSCNAAAIAFYRSQGFTLNGFDRSCYGNDDVQRREVRLDLVFFL